MLYSITYDQKLMCSYIEYSQEDNKNYNFFNLNVIAYGYTIYTTMTANRFFSIGKVNHLFEEFLKGKNISKLSWYWYNHKYPKIFKFYVNFI